MLSTIMLATAVGAAGFTADSSPAAVAKPAIKALALRGGGVVPKDTFIKALAISNGVFGAQIAALPKAGFVELFFNNIEASDFLLACLRVTGAAMLGGAAAFYLGDADKLYPAGMAMMLLVSPPSKSRGRPAGRPLSKPATPPPHRPTPSHPPAPCPRGAAECSRPGRWSLDWSPATSPCHTRWLGPIRSELNYECTAVHKGAVALILGVALMGVLAY